MRFGLAVTLLAAAAWLAVVVRNAGAAPQTVTLGSTTGTPSANICVDLCTYVPFTNVSNPTLVVPFDGTVTSFALKAGSAGGMVELRVLRPAGAGKYTGAGTSTADTLALGLNTFTISMPVKKGDLLGLDNSSSALIFDNSQTTPLTAYYELPALADGATAVPNRTSTGTRLLLSATVQASSTTTTTTTTSTTTPTPTTTTTSTTTQAPPSAPTISSASLSARRFRVASQPTAIAASAPLGTAFRFTLSALASLRIAITRSVAGVRSGRRCVAPTATLRRAHARACRRTLGAGTLKRASEAMGKDRVPFSGRIGHSALAPGAYAAILTVRNAGGRSKPVTLGFVVVAS